MIGKLATVEQACVAKAIMILWEMILSCTINMFFE